MGEVLITTLGWLVRSSFAVFAVIQGVPRIMNFAHARAGSLNGRAEKYVVQ